MLAQAPIRPMALPLLARHSASSGENRHRAGILASEPRLDRHTQRRVRGSGETFHIVAPGRVHAHRGVAAEAAAIAAGAERADTGDGTALGRDRGRRER